LNGTSKLKNPLISIQLFFAICLVIQAGCALQARPGIFSGIVPQVDVEIISTLPKDVQKISADQIIVYPAKKFAPKSYMEMANLRSAGNSSFDTVEEMTVAFQKVAADCGADAIIMLETSTYDPGAVAKRKPKDPNDLSLKDNIVGETMKAYPVHFGISQKQVAYFGRALAIRTKPHN
jgi:hypothetical protein